MISLQTISLRYRVLHCTYLDVGVGAEELEHVLETPQAAYHALQEELGRHAAAPLEPDIK